NDHHQGRRSAPQLPRGCGAAARPAERRPRPGAVRGGCAPGHARIAAPDATRRNSNGTGVDQGHDDRARGGGVRSAVRSARCAVGHGDDRRPLLSRYLLRTAYCALVLASVSCRDAFTTNVTVVASAGSSELTVDRLAEIFAQGKALVVQRDVIE